MPAEWHRVHRISSMVINYLAEVRTDETIQISSGPSRDHSQYIQGTRQEDGKAIFRTRFDYDVTK